MLLTWGLLACSHFGTAGAAMSENAFVQQAQDRAKIAHALAMEKPRQVPPRGITGITVPHHLLAADLIARGVWSTSAGSYDWILLLSPDHFDAHETAFGVTAAPLQSVNGESPPVHAVARELLKHQARVTGTVAAPDEHGVHAVVPFLHAVHAGTPIIAITTSGNADEADWRWMAEQLAAIMAADQGASILIVQSTDFSHHLPVALAAQRDQESLAALSAADPEAILPLVQPAHLDSSGSTYLQAYLQLHSFGAQATVIANRNSSEYVGQGRDTTSYIVAAWSADPGAGSRLAYDDQQILYVAGDFFSGRGLTPFLHDVSVRQDMAAQVRRITNGGALLVNLEGVLLPELPTGALTHQHAMQAAVTAPLLAGMGVVGASLANNHAYDFGQDGYGMSVRSLEDLGIVPLQHGDITDLGGLSILPLTFKRGLQADHAVVRKTDQLEWICNARTRYPLLVLAHWGEEYTRDAGPFENEVALHLAQCGVSVIVGAHSHQASRRVESIHGGMTQLVFSLGNLVFDQRRDKSDSAILEVRSFKQGTVALRLMQFPNLFEQLSAGTPIVGSVPYEE